MIIKMPRRGENIRKRKDGRWEGRYISGHNADGKAKYTSVYAGSYTEVRLKMAKLKSAPAEKSTSSISMRLPQWIDCYLNDLSKKIKPSTYSVYKRYYDGHIKPFFGDIYLSKLSPKTLQNFIDSKHDLSGATVKNIFTFLKSALIEAENQGHIADIWSKVKLPCAKRDKIRVFSRSEQAKLERAILNDENPNILGIMLCLYTGLRVGELCGLMWQDIDFQYAILSVRRTVQRINSNNGERKTKIIAMPPKSIHSNREIPIPLFLLEKLKELKRAGEICEYVFHIHGKPIEPRVYQYWFSRLLETNHIQYAKFHTTRHTFATRALETGMDIKTLSELLGHSDATITLKRYAHSTAEHKQESIENLAKNIFSEEAFGQTSSL